MALPTPTGILKIFFTTPITAGKTLKFTIEKEYAGAKTIFTTLFKLANNSLDTQVSETTINYCAELAANTITGLTILAFSAGIAENPRAFTETLGLQGWIDWVSSHIPG